MAKAEITVGFIPKRDGSDYSPDLQTPLWGKVATEALIEWGSGSRFVVVVIGLIGSGYPSKIDGTTSQGPVTWREFQDVPYQDALKIPGITKAEAFRLAILRSTDPDWTGHYAKLLLGYHNDFLHITAFVLKKV